jgi:hypothetical protein
MDSDINIKNVKFGELVDLFDKRVFAVPHIQRDFVWSKKKVIDLLDSINKHYPIGSFLICKITTKKAKVIKESSYLPDFDLRNNEYCYLVIDGQQRLSVIYSVIKGITFAKERYTDGIDANTICLTKSQGTLSSFEFYKDGTSISLSRILDTKYNKKNYSPRIQKRIKAVYEAFQSYNFPFIFIDDFEPEKMKQAFIRLNTGGTRLSTFDTIMTESYEKDVDLRRHIDKLVRYDLKGDFVNIDGIHIVKAIAANLGVEDFVSSNLHNFAKEVAARRGKYHDLYKKKHRKIEASIKLAADFLHGYIGSLNVPYPAMLSILSVFYYNNKNKQPDDLQAKEINNWFWITGFCNRYSGQNQRDNLIADAEEMRLLAKNRRHRLNLQKRRSIEKFDVNSLLKIKYTNNSAIRNTFFSYLKSRKPLLFSNGKEFQFDTPTSSVLNDKNDHHIFPRKFLYNNGVCRLKDADPLINICFLTLRENIGMGAKAPWEYLKPFGNKKWFRETLKRSIIPECVLQKGKPKAKYEEFKRMRLQQLRKELQKDLGSTSVK